MGPPAPGTPKPPAFGRCPSAQQAGFFGVNPLQVVLGGRLRVETGHEGALSFRVGRSPLRVLSQLSVSVASTQGTRFYLF